LHVATLAATLGAALSKVQQQGRLRPA